jgi:flagellar biosynthesis protein FliR
LNLIMNKADRAKLGIYISFRTLVVAAGAIAIYRTDWANFTLSLVTLFLTFLPTIVKREFHVYYPSEFEIVVLLFIFASMYLGEIHSFYARIWWWDIMLHALSGVIIATIGFSLVDILNGEEKLAVELSPAFVAIFSFGLALSIGALWEIYEFLMDSLFGLNMQKSGLIDTMWDLIVDALGALAVSILGYL